MDYEVHTRWWQGASHLTSPCHSHQIKQLVFSCLWHPSMMRWRSLSHRSKCKPWSDHQVYLQSYALPQINREVTKNVMHTKTAQVLDDDWFVCIMTSTKLSSFYTVCVFSIQEWKRKGFQRDPGCCRFWSHSWQTREDQGRERRREREVFQWCSSNWRQIIFSLRTLKMHETEQKQVMGVWPGSRSDLITSLGVKAVSELSQYCLNDCWCTAQRTQLHQNSTLIHSNGGAEQAEDCTAPCMPESHTHNPRHWQSTVNQQPTDWWLEKAGKIINTHGVKSCSILRITKSCSSVLVLPRGSIELVKAVECKKVQSMDVGPFRVQVCWSLLVNSVAKALLLNIGHMLSAFVCRKDEQSVIGWRDRRRAVRWVDTVVDKQDSLYPFMRAVPCRKTSVRQK